MDRNERAIYTADVKNSMLELVEGNISTSQDKFDSDISKTSVVFPCETNVKFPARNFWEIAKKYLD